MSVSLLTPGKGRGGWPVCRRPGCGVACNAAWDEGGASNGSCDDSATVHGSGEASGSDGGSGEGGGARHGAAEGGRAEDRARQRCPRRQKAGGCGRGDREEGRDEGDRCEGAHVCRERVGGVVVCSLPKLLEQFASVARVDVLSSGWLDAAFIYGSIVYWPPNAPPRAGHRTRRTFSGLSASRESAATRGPPVPQQVTRSNSTLHPFQRLPFPPFSFFFFFALPAALRRTRLLLRRAERSTRRYASLTV